MAPRTSSSTPRSSPDTAILPLTRQCYRVRISDLVIGRFDECSGLSVEYEVLEYPEGGNNEFVHRLRGRKRYPPLSLRRGVTHEDAVLRWFLQYKKPAQRPTLTVELLSQAGVAIRSFSFAEAFPIKWTGPDIDIGSTDVGTEALEVGHEGLI